MAAGLEGSIPPYEKMAEACKWPGGSGGLWVVTEKIHGANFSITSDGARVVYGKRKGALAADDNFFGYKSRIPALCEAKAHALFHLLAAQQDAGTTPLRAVTVYGELFGGAYPHPDVAPDPTTASAVQQGIFYSPSLEFCAFDVAVTDGTGTRVYVDYLRAVRLLGQVGLMCAQPLFVGPLTQALAYDNRFASTIPSLLGLPPLAAENLAEGVVIKPDKARFFTPPSGGAQQRVFVKNKIPEFSERRDVYECRTKPAAAATGPRTYENQGELLYYELAACITDQRLDNVVSKIGRLGRHNCKEALEALLADAEEAVGGEGGRIADLAPAAREQLETEAKTLILARLRASSKNVDEAISS